ncbi:MAG: hypothetical protein HC851_01185 [Acaryochloris sp. RU_4_1]|nr:hypothetical protein [Acaryochloris sp. RU_4_1]NJR55474.1 hypothetical protein [Acaryochloris sp. CRU_2_0]
MGKKVPDSITEISQGDWEKTPESVKRLIANLIEKIEQLSSRIAVLEQEHAALKAEYQLLKEQLMQNSQNSSKPPSQDLGKGFKAKAKQKGLKKPGGQPGHQGHQRPLYPPEQCQSVQDYYPETCIQCGESLNGEDSAPYRVQIVEIPKVPPQVDEHRFHCLECEHCSA